MRSNEDPLGFIWRRCLHFFIWDTLSNIIVFVFVLEHGMDYGLLMHKTNVYAWMVHLACMEWQMFPGSVMCISIPGTSYCIIYEDPLL